MNFRPLELTETINYRVSQLVSRLIGLRHLGRGSVIMLPFTKIKGVEYISIGDGTYIGRGVHLSMTDTYLQYRYTPELVIGNRVQIGNYLTISCNVAVHIGDDVMMSDRVFIGDAIHDYVDPHLHVAKQQMVSRGPVEIGPGAFIGINAVILPGVKIGAHGVVGASAVVTRDVPAYSVVIGNPARIIKYFDHDSGRWQYVGDVVEKNGRDHAS